MYWLKRKIIGIMSWWKSQDTVEVNHFSAGYEVGRKRELIGDILAIVSKSRGTDDPDVLRLKLALMNAEELQQMLYNLRKIPGA